MFVGLSECFVMISILLSKVRLRILTVSSITFQRSMVFTSTLPPLAKAKSWAVSSAALWAPFSIVSM